MNTRSQIFIISARNGSPMRMSDRAVAAAYGWPEGISTEDALEKLLALNLARRTRQEKRS